MQKRVQRPLWRVVVMIGMMAALWARPVAAQNSGAIVGVVRDAQGLAIPGATVTLVNRVSQASQGAVTDEQGKFSLLNLAYGTYVLGAELSGFSPAQRVIEVRSTVPVTTDLALRVGGLTESVEVAADSLLEKSASGSHVDLGADLIDQLPSATPGKQLSAVLLSAPGFIPSQNGRIHVRGSHGQIQYVVDGVPMTDEYTEAFANPLDPRYVKSAEVMTGGIPAEYGGKLAAVVDITSKSGLDDARKATGAASLNVGTFGSVDGGLTVGGRLTPRVGYFVSAGANRTDRYLDTPTTTNLHNAGSAERVTVKLEARPTDRDFVRVIASLNGSRFQTPNRPEAQARGEDVTQALRDNSQTVTWLRQFGDAIALNVVAYRRAATADLDARTAFPLAATQTRTLDHQGGQASLSYSAGAHRFKAGVQFDRNPVSEDFQMRGASIAPFVFSGARTGRTAAAFVQDTWAPTDALRVNVGVRYDDYRLVIADHAVSPRVGAAYTLGQTHTVLRGSYSRIFMPPFAENLLLSSSPQARALAPSDAGSSDVRAERQHAWEVGAQQAVTSRAKLDVAWYRKDIRDVADVDQFLDTTVTFPLSVSKAVAQGVEARLDLPVVGGVNGYLSLARATTLLTAPLTGGLFLGETPAVGERFYADHDQRWQGQFGLSYEHPSPRVFASVTGRVDSGIPFELPGDFDARTFPDQQALSLVNLDTGRARARTLADAMVGAEVYRHGGTTVEWQAAVINVFDRAYLLNFLSIFNGTHYGAPRTWTTRLKVAF